MRFDTLFSAAAILAICNAAPLEASDAQDGLQKRKSVNDCGSSTFVNRVSAGSPLVKDCQTIAKNIAKGGTWTIGCGGNAQRTYVHFGTCAVGAHCTSDDANAAYIGNQDTIDIINASIQKFASNGKVGALGVMGCQSLEGLVGGEEVEWGIYHT